MEGQPPAAAEPDAEPGTAPASGPQGQIGSGLGLVHRAALRTYRNLPKPLRLQAIRIIAPSHTVGALVFLEDAGQVLVLQQRHRSGWTLPGGLVDRGESAQQAAARELFEETGLRIAVDTPLTTVVDGATRRVDVIFHVPVRQRPAVTPRSEAVRAAWLAPDELGAVDDPTSQAFAAFAAARRAGSTRGRLLKS